MVCGCGRCLQSLRGILGHSVQEGQPRVPMRREAGCRHSSSEPVTHTWAAQPSVPQAPDPGSCSPPVPSGSPTPPGLLPSRGGAQGHAFLLLLWRTCWAALGEAELALLEGRSLSLTGPV